MAKRARAPARPLEVREWARLTMAKAICGYARNRGVHICTRKYQTAGEGCDLVEWQGVMAVIEEVLDRVQRGETEPRSGIFLLATPDEDAPR